MQNRISYLDIARGIAIFLVVFGHCISSTTNPINQTILSFHMPLFFVISGMLLSDKPVANRDVKNWMQKKCKHLLVPQVVLGLFECIFVVIHGFFETRSFTMLSFGDIVYAILRWWFLLVLFQVNLISLVLKNFIFKSKVLRAVFMVLLSLTVVLQQTGLILQERLPCYVNVLPFALLFYMAGFFGKSILERSGEKIAFVAIAMLVCIIVSQINEPVLMYDNRYGNFLMFLITSLLGSYAVIGFSQRISSQFFTWLGQVSIIVYVLQFHVNQYCKFGIRMIVEKFVQNNNVAVASTICLTTILSLCICCALAYFISKTRLKIAFGC